MRYPWINVALFFISAALLLTGFFGLTSGAESSRWVLRLHGAAGFGLILMLFWKGRVILDVFRRGSRLTVERLAFILLTLVIIVILATGLFWTTFGPGYVAVFSLMTVHAVLGLLALVLLTWHSLARRYVIRVNAARDRRAFLRLAGLALGGAALWQLSRSTKTALALPAAGRRFTGSYETGSLSGAFPVVSWLFDFPGPVEADTWRLSIDGSVRRPLALAYADLLRLPPEAIDATLDCTGGWYSVQEWRGVSVAQLLTLAGVSERAASFTVQGISGYARRFPLDEAPSFIVATHVGGQVLDHGHGYPARLVAPGHRGYDWVKWIARITVNDTSYLLQPPLPLQ